MLVSFELNSWRDADVSISSLRGYGGSYGGGNATLTFDVQTPLNIVAGSAVPVSAVSQSKGNQSVDDLFYGITVAYNDSKIPAISHQLIIFNRCYHVLDGSITMNPTVKSPTGTSLDCLSKDYLRTGEVSSEAMIVHDFKRSKHAFPAPEITEFWAQVQHH